MIFRTAGCGSLLLHREGFAPDAQKTAGCTAAIIGSSTVPCVPGNDKYDILTV
ncbi:hypothetical protein HMPREF1548_06844 [Clostridium sp. KLE 1755]|nr:hypothetical protein HMPREF1548_06844 [Clostridium sp. KLE 1755]